MSISSSTYACLAGWRAIVNECDDVVRCELGLTVQQYIPTCSCRVWWQLSQTVEVLLEVRARDSKVAEGSRLLEVPLLYSIIL
jgi:hypothetical protein